MDNEDNVLEETIESIGNEVIFQLEKINQNIKKLIGDSRDA